MLGLSIPSFATGNGLRAEHKIANKRSHAVSTLAALTGSKTSNGAISCTLTPGCPPSIAAFPAGGLDLVALSNNTTSVNCKLPLLFKALPQLENSHPPVCQNPLAPSLFRPQVVFPLTLGRAEYGILQALVAPDGARLSACRLCRLRETEPWERCRGSRGTANPAAPGPGPSSCIPVPVPLYFPPLRSPIASSLRPCSFKQNTNSRPSPGSSRPTHFLSLLLRVLLLSAISRPPGVTAAATRFSQLLLRRL
ncbi:hypothetical protein TARUN_1751 [Trichoderma arundinaceum]|uniref:Uncharacterized protein n=1 Tax=Trichoderma arundinaceum TaxID=490622 RepID=A0A395NWL8_TRIAR|nr:hypothetical protein TARUN_1751 [Trichoderma arundinaceum]